MSLDPDAPAHIEISDDRGRRRTPWLLGLIAVAVVAGLVSWRLGVRPAKLWAHPVQLATLKVDRGDVLVRVVETGALESADNATVRCKVEALVGLTGGAAGAGQAGRGAAGARPAGAGAAQPGGVAAGGQGGQGGANPQNANGNPPQGKDQAKKKGGKAAPKPRPGAPKVGTAAATQAQAADNPSAAGNASGGAGQAGAAGQTGATGDQAADSTVVRRPIIRSFTYQVAPHVPLRPQPNPQQAQQPKAAPPVDPAQQQRNRGGGQPQVPQTPGASRIISILPEGTRVRQGDVVCELDSSAFRDEVQAQKIRYAQAKAFVEQARAILEVNEISLREYRDGIFPQDVQLIQQYIATCQIEADRARKNLAWSRQTAAKKFRSSFQVNADVIAAERAELELREAKGMATRLHDYTGPRILKSLAAKSQAIRADKLSLESTFQLESDRLRRLESMVENCTMRAPRDGIVVYFVQSNRWGRVDNQIQEGVTVREGQPIFNVPNPKNMLVRALVNESKIAMIQPGQDAEIRIDAFPERPLEGTVSEVTPIPAPLNALSDVRVYYATVRIKSGGFDELRPGLSAEVAFDVQSRHDVTRVPLQAVRWKGDAAYVALASRPGSAEPPWSWREVSLGASNDSYAEVIAGLKPGDRVVADPESLPAPVRTPKGRDSRALARTDAAPQD